MVIEEPDGRGRPLPSGVVAFLFSDIEGSTRLLATLGEAYKPLLADHRRLLRAVWAEREGAEVGTEGDSFFVAFARPWTSGSSITTSAPQPCVDQAIVAAS